MGASEWRVVNSPLRSDRRARSGPNSHTNRPRRCQGEMLNWATWPAPTQPVREGASSVASERWHEWRLSSLSLCGLRLDYSRATGHFSSRTRPKFSLLASSSHFPPSLTLSSSSASWPTRPPLLYVFELCHLLHASYQRACHNKRKRIQGAYTHMPFSVMMPKMSRTTESVTGVSVEQALRAGRIGSSARLGPAGRVRGVGVKQK